MTHSLKTLQPDIVSHSILGTFIIGKYVSAMQLRVPVIDQSSTAIVTC